MSLAKDLDVIVGDEVWTVPGGFIDQSDGCTFPSWLKWLRKPLKADEYKPICLLHDFLIEYHILPRHYADKLVKRWIRDERDDPVRAHIFWWGVKLGRLSVKHPSRVLPHRWLQFEHPRKR